MNKEVNKKYKLPEQAKDNPFTVPEAYFNSFAERLNERLEGESKNLGEADLTRIVNSNNEGEKESGGIWLRIRPHFALAAAISGFALVSFTIIRLIIGPGNIDEYYDLAFLDETGILNESAFQETLAESDEYSDDTYTDWEVDAMEYLASNEVNLEALLSEN